MLANNAMKLCLIFLLCIFVYFIFQLMNTEVEEISPISLLPATSSSSSSSAASSTATSATPSLSSKSQVDAVPSLQFLEFSLHEGSRAEITSTLLHLNQHVVVGSTKGKNGPHQSLFDSNRVKYLAKYPQAIHTVTNQRNQFISNQDMEQMFYELRADGLIQNTHAFICTNPMSFCESFLAFNRSIVWMAGHRYAAGRCNDIKQWLRLNDNIIKSIEVSSKMGRRVPLNILATLSRYDAEYIEFFTGVRPIIVEPTASFYGTTHSMIDDGRYKKLHAYIKSIDEIKSKLVDKPSKARLKHISEVVVNDKVVYKHNILYGPATLNDLPQMQATAFVSFATHYNLTFTEIRQEYQKFNLYELTAHPAMIIFPFTTHSHLIAEIYTMGIPLFIPSIKFLAQLNIIDDNDCNGQHSMTSIHPTKHEDTVHGNRSPESHEPNDIAYWLQFTMYYDWPHIAVFNSWKELMELFTKAFSGGNTYLIDIHDKMMEFNKKRIEHSLSVWRSLINNISDHDRHQFRHIPSNYTYALRSIYGMDHVQV